jgi:2-phosphosulfolactate phosphatase
MLGCAGGIELAEVGFVADVEIAAQHDVSEVVPVLVGESFRDAAGLEPRGARLRGL